VRGNPRQKAHDIHSVRYKLHLGLFYPYTGTRKEPLNGYTGPLYVMAMRAKPTGSCGIVETAFATVHPRLRAFGQTYVRVQLEVMYTTTTGRISRSTTREYFPDSFERWSNIPSPTTCHQSQLTYRWCPNASSSPHCAGRGSGH
jgi:hypothetical protein